MWARRLTAQQQRHTQHAFGYHDGVVGIYIQFFIVFCSHIRSLLFASNRVLVVGSFDMLKDISWQMNSPRSSGLTGVRA